MAKVSPVRSVYDSEDERPQSKGRANKKSKDSEEPMEVDGDQEDEGDEGDGEEYEIEAILDAKRGSFPNGRTGYFVKWKGYPESENSWVDENDAGNAIALIEEYWRKKKAGRKSSDGKIPKKPRKSVAPEEVEEVESISTATKKRGRKSQADAKDETTASDARATKKTKKNGAASKEDDSHPTEDEVVVGNMSRFMNVKSWETLVATIDTIERSQDGGLRVYFTLKDGERVEEDSKICAQRFPQKLIQFYEGNLRWKSAGGDEDES